MDAIAPALIGLGLWLCYEAWTNPSAAPIVKIKQALGAPSAASTVAPLGGAGSPNQPSVTTIAPAGQLVPGATIQPS
jgi:hypothetical protein